MSSSASSEKQKSKAQLRADRRAKQEGDRASKADKKAQQGKGTGAQKEPQQKQPISQQPEHNDAADRKMHNSSSSTVKVTQLVAGLVLPIDKEMKTESLATPDEIQPLNSAGISVSNPSIHPGFLRFGVQCRDGVIDGSDAVVVGLIRAFRQYVEDFEKAPDRSWEANNFGRDMETAIRPQISFLTGGRPLPAALGNLLRQFKHHMTNLPTNITDDKARESLLEWLDDYVQEKITLAFEAISLFTREKLHPNSLILTYSWCPLVEKVLVEANRQGLDFRVLVLDSHPLLLGRLMIRRLTKQGISCSYAFLSALAYVIKECSVALLGAEAVLGNGSVLGRMGSGQLGLVARKHNVPLLVLCPTHKFVEKVQSGSEQTPPSIFCGEPSEVVPTELVSGIVTELRLLPPSSAPAVLRVKNAV